MTDLEIIIRLPEALSKEAEAFGLLSSEHIERLLRAKNLAELAAMANDHNIQREIAQIADEFSVTESDGL
jgi:hypothetical protein